MSIKFGTDGWRAVIAKAFTFENLTVLTQAVADYIKAREVKNPKIVIGYDSRFLSKEFAHCTAEVLCANHIKVVLSNDKVPTPVVSFYVKNKKCSLGLMITASHNPYDYNGVKIKTPDGGSADLDLTGAVESLLYKSEVKRISLAEAKNKKLAEIKDLSTDYVKFIRSYINLKSIKKLKMSVLVDLMHGSGGFYLEQILAGSSVKISYLNKDINPSFGGINPEPIEKNLASLIQEMKKGVYDFGIALDGDGDRIACVLKGGRYVTGQVLLPLLAVHLVKNKNISGGIVKTVGGSNLIDDVALVLNRPLFETPIGFKHIAGIFSQEDIMVGGEEAGGIGFKDYIPDRDGNMAASLLLEMAAMTGKKPDVLIQELESKFGRWFYSRSSVPVAEISKDFLEKINIPKTLLSREVVRVNTLDGVKIITDKSWLMLRVSGTEPIVRVYSESPTQEESDELLNLGLGMLNDLRDKSIFSSSCPEDKKGT